MLQMLNQMKVRITRVSLNIDLQWHFHARGQQNALIIITEPLFSLSFVEIII